MINVYFKIFAERYYTITHIYNYSYVYSLKVKKEELCYSKVFSILFVW